MRDFSAKQEKALAALLTEKDIRSAAVKAGVSEATVFRWLAEDDFKAEYRRLRRDAVEQAAAQIQQVSSEAVEALRKNLACGNPSAEIAAARIILENAYKAIDLMDIQQRLEMLENAVQKQNRKA